jgi:TolB-like protein
MPGDPNKLSHFWQELKRRRVVHVIVVYATAAFVILEAVDIIFPRLNFPDWTVTFVMILLALGFPIALIFSWIFDVTPEGIEKTKPLKKDQRGENVSISGSWRIATYVSVVIIVGLIAFNIFGGNRGARVDESLEKFIAVLPFYNYSGDIGQDFICNGLTAEIISHLNKIASFDEVRSLTTVLNFKDSNKSTTEIAEALQVNYILTGTYKRIGDQFRVTAQLIEGKSDNYIWQQDYDQPWMEKNTIPADIALQIADQLKIFLTTTEKQSIQKLPTTEKYVFDFFKQAEQLGADQSTYALDQQTIDLVIEAIEQESDYSQAYAMLGGLTLQKANYGGGAEMYSAGWEALTYLEKALEYNPDNGIAHIYMGVLNEWFIWDYVKAEREYLRGLELLPDYRIFRTGYGGQFLVKMNRVEDAAKYTIPLQAYSDDPFYFVYQHDEIRRLIIAGNDHEAYHSIERFLEVWKNDGFIWAGTLFTWLTEYDTALYYLEAGAEDPEISIPIFQASLALASNKTGHYEEAQRVIQQLKERSDTTSAGSPAFFLGWYYSGIEEPDSAFIWLEKAYRNRSPEMPWLKVDPGFNNLKEDPRYWNLYQRTGHKAYDDYVASKEK